MIRLPQLSSDDGMTLVEVLVTIVIGMIVLGAALDLMTGGFTSSARVQDRADAASRARLSVDRVTTLLQAQVCNGDQSPVVSGDATQVTFNANLGDREGIPTRYQLLYSGNRLYERRWPMNPIPNSTTGVYSTAGAFVQKILAERVEPIQTSSPVAPVFRFFRTDDTVTNEQVEMGVPLTSSAATLVPPLPPNDRRRVLRIDLQLRVLPTRNGNTTQAKRVSSRLLASAYATSSIDPAKLEKGPQCSAPTP